MRIDLRGAHLYDPARRVDRVADMLIEDGHIAAVGEGLPHGDFTLDCHGWLVTPGFADIHVHLREPGQTHKEDIRSGLRAARAGGFTDVCAMANTTPPIDTPDMIRATAALAAGDAVGVHQLGAITQGMRGERLTEFGLLRRAGAVALSDDGHGVARSDLMRLALQYAQAFDLVLVQHAEEPTLSGDGVLHQGEISFRMGLPGQPRSAEAVMVARDLQLLREVGGRLHVAHVSTRETVELVRQAKADGLRVTCEVTPHHLVLTDADVERIGPDAKVNPPIRTEDDRQALIAALADGTIDALATDHAPHATAEKAGGWMGAPFGAIGLETAFGVAHTALVRSGQLSLKRLIAALTHDARRCLDLAQPTLAEGDRARLTLVDPAQTWQVGPPALRGRSQNSPFHAMRLEGRPQGIITGGQWVQCND